MSAHAAILRLPLQRRLHQPMALRRLLGNLAFALLPAAVFTTSVGGGWWGFAAGYGLGLLLFIWWHQVAGLVAQNQPQLARLLPGQCAALRLSLLAQALVLALPATALIAGTLGNPAGWLIWVLALQLLVAWLQREPWLWLPAGLGVTPLFYGLHELQTQMSTAPLGVHLLLFALWAGLLSRSLGSGGRVHRWQHSRLRDWQRLFARNNAGRPGPLQAAPLRWLGRFFTWPQRVRTQYLLRQASPANALVRLDLGLGSDGQWPVLLWVLTLIAAGLGAVAWAVAAIDGALPWRLLIDNGRFGLCIGVFSAACSPMLGRAAALWARRREQALLTLLPGHPAELGAAMEQRWRRQHLIHWGLASMLVLSIAAQGSASTLEFAAASSAFCLPLIWWVQMGLRRLTGPDLKLWHFGPAMSALPAFAAQHLGVPGWLSLSLGLAVYLLCAKLTKSTPLRLPLGRDSDLTAATP